MIPFRRSITYIFNIREALSFGNARHIHGPLPEVVWKRFRPDCPSACYTGSLSNKSGAGISYDSVEVETSWSEDKANTYVADGIQDEIPTRLSKIADLKVISRGELEAACFAGQHYRVVARCQHLQSRYFDSASKAIGSWTILCRMCDTPMSPLTGTTFYRRT